MFSIVVDYQSFSLFPSFHVQLERELSDRINWNDNVENIVEEMVSEIKGEKFYLLVDEGSDMSLDQLNLFYQIVNCCISFKKKVVVATSSGRRWLAPKNVRRRVSAAHALLENITMLPFTIDEAKLFLSGIDMKFFKDIVKYAGTNPFMLRYFTGVTNDKAFASGMESMTLELRDMLGELKIAEQDDLNRYETSIQTSLKWLIRASSNSIVYTSDLKEYYGSYVAHEFLTFLVDEKLWKEMEFPQESEKAQGTNEGTSEAGEGSNETQVSDAEDGADAEPSEDSNESSETSETGAGAQAEADHYSDVETQNEVDRLRIFLSYPLSLAMFSDKLLENVKLRSVMNPVVMGYVLERKFFLSPQINSFTWNVKAMRVSDPTQLMDIEFSSIERAKEQESHHILRITNNQIHFLKQGHGAIDALFVARDGKNTDYLVLIQLSSSNYASHQAKHHAICGKIKIPEHGTHTILNYYSTISEIGVEQTLYLYLSPKELMTSDSRLDQIFDISSRESRQQKKTQKKAVYNYLVGLLHQSSQLANLLETIMKIED